MSEHTKGKLVFEESDFTIRTKDFQSNAGMGDYRGIIIANLDSENWRSVRPDSIPIKKANAQELVKRWNSHEELVGACENLLLALDCSPCCNERINAQNQAKAALAAAKE